MEEKTGDIIDHHSKFMNFVSDSALPQVLYSTCSQPTLPEKSAKIFEIHRNMSRECDMIFFWINAKFNGKMSSWEFQSFSLRKIHEHSHFWDELVVGRWKFLTKNSGSELLKKTRREDFENFKAFLLGKEWWLVWEWVGPGYPTVPLLSPTTPTPTLRLPPPRYCLRDPIGLSLATLLDFTVFTTIQWHWPWVLPQFEELFGIATLS